MTYLDNDIGYLSGDTRVKLKNEYSMELNTLHKKFHDGDELEIMTFNENGNLISSKVTSISVNHVTELLYLSISGRHHDHIFTEKCTPNCRFKLYDGTYKRANELTELDEILCRYRHPSDVINTVCRVRLKNLIKYQTPIPVYSLNTEDHNFCIGLFNVCVITV